MIYCAAYNDNGKRKHEQAFTWQQRTQAAAWCHDYELRGYKVLMFAGRRTPKRYQQYAGVKA